MGKGLIWAAGGLLGMTLVAGLVRASDECEVEMPNPFTPVPVHTESRGAKWRHGFHDMRTTWDKYFQVYPKELDGFEVAPFEKVRTNPGVYLDRKIRFDLYWGKPGTFFRPFTSPFHEHSHVNFTAWAYTAELWTKQGRSEVHPLFYVDRRKTEMIDKLMHLPLYSPIHVWTEVKSKSEGLPWIEIVAFEIIPEVAQREDTLRHVELGFNQLAKKRYDLAAHSLEQAVALEMPVQVEQRVYSMLGRCYYELRQFNRARYALVQAVLRDNKVVNNLILLARSDLRTDRPEEAKQAMDRAIVLDPANAEAHAELGLALAMLGDVRNGYKELDFAQKLAPRGQLPEAHRNRAMVAMREGKLTLAKEELSKAVLLRATDFSLHLELGDVYLAMNSLADARQEYQQAKELANQRPEPFYKIALVLKIQGDAMTKENKPEDAKKFYEEALDNVKQAIGRDDTFTPAYGLEAEILRALNREADAKKALQKGAEANPKSLAMQDTFYEQAAALHDWEGMEAATRRALELKPSARHYSRLGNVLSSRPDPDYAGAEAAYREAVRLDAGSSEDWAALAHIRTNFLADYAGGEQAAVQAVNIDRENGGAWLDLALSRNQLQAEGAITAAEEAAKLTKSVQARLLLAHLRVTAGQGASALELATSAAAEATLEGDKAWAQSIQAAALTSIGKTEDAIEAFQAADATLKDSAEHNLWYGYALQKNGDLSGAQERFSSAAALTRGAGTPLSARINSDAQKAMKVVAKTTRTKVDSDVAKTKEKPTDDTTARKPMPPVIEENGNGNGQTEPMPVEVPAPR